MIRKIISLRCFSFLLFFLISTSAIKPPKPVDFTGNWKLNVSKSDFTQADPSVSCVELSIQQGKDSITIARVNLADDGSKKINTETLSFSSGISQYEVDYGKKSVKIKWTDNYQALIRIAQYDLDYGTAEKHYTATEVMKLSKDGKILTDDLTIEHKSGRKYSVKAVYDKQ